MLGHVRADLVERCDREPRYDERAEAQAKWETLVVREVGL